MEVIQYILLCTRSQSLLSVKLFLLEGGLFVLTIFDPNRNGHLESIYFMHFVHFFLIWTFASPNKFWYRRVRISKIILLLCIH